MDHEAVPAPPALSLEATEELNARTPFSWVREALDQGVGGDVLHLMTAWMAFSGLTGTAWAFHLRSLAGWSALPNYWGDRITARDIWELSENGGWSQEPLGTPTLVLAVLCLLWVLWAGWRLQARVVNLPHRLGPWVWGFFDAVLIGALPLLTLGLGTTLTWTWLGTSGIQGLGWMRLVLSPLLQATTVSAFMLQWWFCRLGRARGNLHSPSDYGRHLGQSFLRLWMHPVQWFVLLFGAATLRAAFGFGVLLLGWRWGGGTPARVWSLILLQLVASAAGAWILGAQLRICALFWRQDQKVRDARSLLRSAFS
jgi:hypothetical protein